MIEEKSEKEVAGLPTNKIGTANDLNVSPGYSMGDLPETEPKEKAENIELIYPTNHLRGI